MKLCTKCNLLKSLEEYYKGRSDCKKCKISGTVSSRKVKFSEDSEYRTKWLESNRQRCRGRYPKYKALLKANTYRRRKSDPFFYQLKRAAKKYGIRPDLLKEVWDRCQGMCTMCQSKVDLTFDHILPISLGYKVTKSSDLQILCRSCNSFKRNHIILHDGKTLMVTKG